MKIYCLPEKVVTLEEKSLEKIDIAIQKAVLRGCFFCFQMIVKSKKWPAARFQKGERMIAANTSYKQNGVPVSIPSGSYGIAHLTVHQYEYPKGHPCHNCPYTLRTSVPSCMFPERRDGGCLWYDLKKQRRPPLPAVYPKNQAAAERIFAFVEVLKDVMKRKGYQERRKPIAK